MIRKMKKLFKYIDSTCKISRDFTYLGLKSSCILLLFALLTAVSAGDFGIHNLSKYHMARELVNTSYSVLLVSTLGAGIIEDFSKNK